MKSKMLVDRTKTLQDNKFDPQESRAAKDIPRPKNAILIRRLDIKPRNQESVPLGSFTTETEPRGFLVEVDPDPSPADSVVTEVTRLGGSAHRYSLHLHITNSSSKTVSADVWRL